MRWRPLLVLSALALAAWITPAPAGAAVHSGVQVQLLDPGANPRAALRFKPGTTPESRTLTFTTQVTQSGISSRTSGPLSIQAAVSIAESSGSNSTIRQRFTYQGLRLLDSSVGAPQELAAARAALAQLNAFSGQATLSSSGAIISSHFTIPPGVSSSTRGLLQQLSDQANQLGLPLPTQPVGIGARWRTTTRLAVGGIKVSQTYEYTLRNRDGARLTLDVRYTQTAPRQRVTTPGLPAGATITLTSYNVTGSGISVVDLSQVTPVSAHLTAQGLQVFSAQQGGQSGAINQQVQLGVDLAAG